MSFFSRFKKEKPVDWSDAYTAKPQFYENTDGTPFGAIALTEGTKTILPKAPQERYAVEGKAVSDWRMVLVSTTKDDIVGDCDYFRALDKLGNHILDSKSDSILVAGLSLTELEALAEN